MKKITVPPCKPIGFPAKILFVVSALFFALQTSAQMGFMSPGKNITVLVNLSDSGTIQYSVNCGTKEVLKPSSLGLKTGAMDFTRGMEWVAASPEPPVDETYRMMHGKKSEAGYYANRQVLKFRNKAGALLHIIFQVSNDGVAFQYVLPNAAPQGEEITAEATSFHFPLTAKAWLQPMQEAKTGWEQTNPAYEEHYKQDIAVGTPSPTAAGWVYPALFRSNGIWVLISEASVESNHCATRLQAHSPDGEYFIGFPDPREIIPGKGLLSVAKGSYASPWRLMTIGSLATIAESTLGTDLAKPSVVADAAFVKPGKASWSWINSKDDFITYDEQKKYIDYAADMQWQYCLVDAAWDRKIGYEKIKELATYAATKKVGLLLWYNSAGNWNTVKYTPKDLLLTHESRVKEFQRLKDMGIKGVKIDFFAGDGQSVMAYYHEILKDAADYALMVNFHGATLPRGWSRTYPHLVTTEAVRGFEMITFNQQDADLEANHCTMLPFTRNVFDPMDYTPMNLYKIQTQVQRKTTSSFELALSVLFTSGIQHYAESPDGMQQVPGFVKEFLRSLPDTWEDVKFVDGFPGEFVVIARRHKNRWYIAGINGGQTERKIILDPVPFGKKQWVLITEGESPLSFSQKTRVEMQPQTIAMPQGGGFVMMVE